MTFKDIADSILVPLAISLVMGLVGMGVLVCAIVGAQVIYDGFLDSLNCSCQRPAAQEAETREGETL